MNIIEYCKVQSVIQKTELESSLAKCYNTVMVQLLLTLVHDLNIITVYSYC